MRKYGINKKDSFIILFIFIIILPLFFMLSYVNSGETNVSYTNLYSNCFYSQGKLLTRPIACIITSGWLYFYENLAYGIFTGLFSWKGLGGLIIFLGTILYMLYRFKKNFKVGLIYELYSENRKVIKFLLKGLIILIFFIVILTSLIYIFFNKA